MTAPEDDLPSKPTCRCKPNMSGYTIHECQQEQPTCVCPEPDVDVGGDPKCGWCRRFLRDTTTNPVHDYTVCDGLCVPDECVCPSVEARTAEVRKHVAAEQARIERKLEAFITKHNFQTWGVFDELRAAIRGGDDA